MPSGSSTTPMRGPALRRPSKQPKHPRGRMVMAQKVSNAPREWYRIAAKAEDPSVAEIDIYDFIGDWIDGYWGFGVTAKQFLEQLVTLPDAVKTVKLRINSPGGDVYSATAIANLLRD